MPKRNAEEKIEKYLKKLEKWKKKRRSRCLSSSDSEPENYVGEAHIEAQIPEVEIFSNPEEIEILPTVNAQPIEEPVIEPPNSEEPGTEPPNAEEPVVTPSAVETVEAANTEEAIPNPELDANILAALGEIADDSPDFGDKIHDSLAKIWTPLLKKGITRDCREKLYKEYLIPENCPLLKSPTLNPEIMAAIPETGRIRDKKISASQQQLGIGITAINRGLNTLLTSDNKIEAIKSISDGCRLLSDLHFQQTETRKKFITPGLDKPFLQLIQIAERDETLFGNTLSEKIKASKAIVTQSKQIKKSTAMPKPSTSQPAPRANNQGNWQGPPRFPSHRGGRGGFKRTNQRFQQLAPTAPQPQSQPNAFPTRSRGTTRQPPPPPS